MTRPLLLLLAAVHAVSLAACVTPGSSPAPQGRTLRAFRSEAELAAFHRRMAQRWAVERARQAAEERRRQRNDGPGAIIEYGYQYYQPTPRPPGLPRQNERVTLLSTSQPLAEVRQEGGDERPMVQVQGDHLLVLRRGRLFSVRIGGGALQPVSWVDAFGYLQVGAWYDELLAFGGRAVVIGGNYLARDTELNLFRLAPDGEPAFHDTYYVQSRDALMETHTYAARTDGDRLVFYSSQWLDHDYDSGRRPHVSRWGTPRQPTAPATRIYREPGDDPPLGRQVMHTVTRCGPEGDGLRCESTALFGPPAHVFHVSPTAVYLWTAAAGARPSVLYRMPLNGSAPTALQVSGEPPDPSAFLESADGHLNVLLHAQPAAGEPQAPQPLALLRVPLAELGDGTRAAAPSDYRTLPLDTPGPLRHRFVGDWLVYGASGWNPSEVYAVRWAGGPVSKVTLAHPIHRIEAMGSGAVVMGTDGSMLHLETLRLGPDSAVAVQRVALPGDSIHGFFYHPEGTDAGVVAVPVSGPLRPGLAGQLLGADQIRFFRNRGLRLEELGELSAGPFDGDDECVISCLNWYRGTRPLFVGGRIFALLGYELVEAREEEGRLRELRRVSFAPHWKWSNPRGSWMLTEALGEPGGPVSCTNRGEMQVDSDSTGLSVRLRRTDCVDGDSATVRWEGRGKAEASGNAVRLEVNACTYQGRLTSPGHLQGRVACRARLRDGSAVPVSGTWEARRAGS